MPPAINPQRPIQILQMKIKNIEKVRRRAQFQGRGSLGFNVTSNINDAMNMPKT